MSRSTGRKNTLPDRVRRRASPALKAALRRSMAKSLHLHLRPFVDMHAVPAWEPRAEYGVIGTMQLRRTNMGFGKGALLWLLGVPLPIILLLAVFWHH
jgi:hypothetical protein